MSHGLILTDALSSACWEKKEKKRKKRKRSGREAFFPGPEARSTLLAVPALFLRLLGAIKG
jgi:hypothetical protein